MAPSLQPKSKLRMSEFTVTNSKLPIGFGIAMGVILVVSTIHSDSVIWIYFVSTIAIFIKLNSVVVKDTLLVMPSLGVQLMCTTALGTKSGIRFIPVTGIESVFINEAIRRQHVISYLVFKLKVPDKDGKLLVPVFQKTQPRLQFLISTYREVHKILSE